MGDFLDDYLDGLGEGQRFNPLPYGPYYGTKDKRQWHLLADSEREQAIFEARMREEEESASFADEGASAEGGSGAVPEKLILDRRFVENTPSGPPVVEFQDDQTTDTFGTIANEDGRVTYIEEDLAASGIYDTQVTVTSLTHDELVSDADVDIDPMNTTYGSQVYNLGMSYGSGVIWVSTIQSIPASYPGFFDSETGVAKPMYAIGGNYAVVFRYLDVIESGYGVFGLYISTDQPSGVTYTDHGSSAFDLDVNININMPSSHFLETVKLAYEQQSVKKWSYGVVEVTS